MINPAVCIYRMRTFNVHTSFLCVRHLSGGLLGLGECSRRFGDECPWVAGWLYLATIQNHKTISNFKCCI